MYKILSFLILVPLGHLEAQKSFSAEFHFSKEFDLNKLQYSYDNGIETYKYIKPKIEGNRLIFEGSFQSEFATIWLSYPTEKEPSNYYSAFWVGEKPAKVFINNIDSSLYSPLAAESLENAFQVSNEGGRLLDEFANIEQKEYNDFFNKHWKDYKNNDSIAHLLYQKEEMMIRKQIDFLSKHPMGFFTLWYFNHEIAVTPSLPKDTLIQYFEQIFTDTTLKFDRDRILKSIKTKPIVRNTLAPSFDIKDIEGKSLKLAELRGKGVLLVYWASWCGPCIAEIPTLKRIREIFPEDQLEIISITKDETYPPYQRALQALKMPWRHVYGNSEIVEMYNVTGIPHVILIDKNGYIKYDQYGYDKGESENFINEVRKSL